MERGRKAGFVDDMYDFLISNHDLKRVRKCKCVCVCLFVRVCVWPCAEACCYGSTKECLDLHCTDALSGQQRSVCVPMGEPYFHMQILTTTFV